VASSAVSDHVCATSTEGDLLCWGRNDQGQTGTQTVTELGAEPNSLGDNLPPVDMTSAGVVQIDSGCSHTCALMEDASLKCFGGSSEMSENPALGLSAPCYAAKLSYSGSTNRDDCASRGCSFEEGATGLTGRFESTLEFVFGLKSDQPNGDHSGKKI
jgi:hypothetical protein